jgi:hypothetical protein
LDLEIRVCVPLFRIWRNAAILSGWINTLRIEGFKFKCCPPIQAPILSTLEEEISNKAVWPLEDFLVNGELHKLNKQLSQIVELKKLSNMMVGTFYVCTLPFLGVSMLFRLGILI